MSETREAIHDESHARALLKSWLRKYKLESSELVNKSWPEMPSSRSKAFKQMVDFYRAVIGDGLIFDTIQVSRMGKRKEYIAFSLEALELDIDTKNVSLVLNIPICITIVDSKRPNDLPRIGKPFLLSEHLLCRVIQRTHCSSLIDLAAFFLPLITLLYKSNLMDRSKKENLICLFGDGYYATTYDEEKDFVVFKTWVAAGNWTPKNEAKLSLIAQKLTDEGLVVLISEDEFESSAFLAPDNYLKDAIRILGVST